MEMNGIGGVLWGEDNDNHKYLSGKERTRRRELGTLGT